MDSKRQLEIVGLISDQRFMIAKCFAEVNINLANLQKHFLL